MNNICVIDIETAPLSAEEREPFRPSLEPAKNLRDPEKIKSDLAAKEAAWKSDSALSSLTGRILCVGCWTEKQGVFVIEAPEESDIVQAALDLIEGTITGGGKVVGFCSNTFDIPFLCQRAWRLGVHVPRCLRNGRWWSSELVDLADIWNAPGTSQRISLDHLAKALGVGSKNGDGKDFGALWKTNKPAALGYCRNDIDLIRLCAERMLQ